MIQRTFFARAILLLLDERRRNAAISGDQKQAPHAVHGSIAAVPLALPETGASPITSTSACSASLTPWPVTPESSSVVFFPARLSRSFCFFSSSASTASILLSATIS